MNYIWDLDGTLIDSYGVIVSSLVDVAGKIGVTDPEAEILRAVKQGAVSVYLRRLSEKTGADYDALYREYRQISHEREDAITLIPGAVNTLRGLRDQGGRILYIPIAEALPHGCWRGWDWRNTFRRLSPGRQDLPPSPPAKEFAIC